MQEKSKFNIFTYIKKHPIIFAITLIVIFIMVPISFYVENPWGIGFIPRSEAGNVLGYYGAILGGGLTIFGVAWTLDRQNKEHKDSLKLQKKISDNELAESKRQFDLELKQKQDELNRLKEQRIEDLVIQYKPILKITFLNYIFQNDNTMLILHLQIENIGRGESDNITITSTSENPLYSQVIHPNVSILGVNNTHQFDVAILHLGKVLGDGKIERLSLLDSHTNTPNNQNPKINANVTINYFDDFGSLYKVEFKISCEYLVPLTPLDLQNLNMQQISDKIKISPKSWKVDLQDIKTTKIHGPK